MRYQNSVLGVLWVLIKPYATFAVMYVVWTRIVNVDIPNYQLYLLSGIILFSYFNELILLGQMSLLDNAHIILKVNFPRQIVVLSTMLSGLINLGINLIFFIVIAVISGVQFTYGSVLYFIFIVGIIFLFAMGVSFFTSVISIRFRDLKNIFELGIILLQWVTPVFYAVSSNLFSGRTSDYIAANPLGIVINQGRAAFDIYGTKNISLMIIYFIISFIIFLIGWRYFNKSVKKVAEHF
jgi:ABC-2 type transport system permease protein